MWLRKLAIVALLVGAPRAARADVALGLFLGEPTGIDLKLGLSPKSALDILVGWYNQYDNWNDDSAYVHVTYLVQPFITYGESVMVPFRIGIGGAIFDDRGRYNEDLNLAVRVPFQIGFMFRRTPLEIYAEIALKATIIDENNNHRAIDLDGGIGLRVYF
jgi:hypothetical protein